MRPGASTERFAVKAAVKAKSPFATETGSKKGGRKEPWI
jgi:hypothetical protein